MKEKLSELNHTLDSFFVIHNSEFVKVNKRSVTNTSFIYCSDIKGLCEFVQQKRACHQVHLKFGFDGGVGFFKVTLSIQNLIHDSEEIHRQRYTDGISPKSFKNSGVKISFILGLVPTTQDNYENVSKLWSFLKLNEFQGTLATDLKLVNILGGLITHASSTPCTYCDTTERELHKCGKYRTLSDCLRNYDDWQKRGGKKHNAKRFKNCNNKPVFVGDEQDQLIHFLPPPELYLMLGVVNKLYDNICCENSRMLL